MIYKNFNTELSSSLEDYIEEMYNIYVQGERIRVKDLSDRMNVKKSSVNNAVAKLKEKNIITQEKYSDIILTPMGFEIGKQVKERHDFFYNFFTKVLGVSEENAEKDACAIEHVISDESIEKLKNHCAGCKLSNFKL